MCVSFAAETLRTEDLDLPQGAFREGNWKLLVNVWCSGYYSFDPTVIQVSFYTVSQGTVNVPVSQGDNDN